MVKVGLFTDAASDIIRFPTLMDQLDLHVIPQYINIGEETYTYKSLTLDELLKKMKTVDKENWPKTSQPSVGDFIIEYQKMKDKGYTDLISVHVAGKASGTLNSARLASQEIEGMNIYLVDSQMASIGIIPSLVFARDLIDRNTSPVEIQDRVNKFANSLELFGAVPKLDNLYKGGRLKSIKYRLGKLLGFKPILQMKKGVLGPYDRTRNLQATQERAYNHAVNKFDTNDNFELFIAHAWAEETALKFVKKFKEEFPGRKYHVGQIGPAIGVHLGPEGLLFAVNPKPSQPD